jgi:hypothetical protein
LTVSATPEPLPACAAGQHLSCADDSCDCWCHFVDPEPDETNEASWYGSEGEYLGDT